MHIKAPRPSTSDSRSRLAAAKGCRVAAVLALAAVGWPALAWAAELAVSQHNLHFSVPAITIHAGDTLHFTNDDNVSHNISVRGAADGDTEDLGVQKPHDVVSYRFADKRVYSVVCSIHPGMRLRVIVD